MVLYCVAQSQKGCGGNVSRQPGEVKCQHKHTAKWENSSCTMTTMSPTLDKCIYSQKVSYTKGDTLWLSVETNWLCYHNNELKSGLMSDLFICGLNQLQRKRNNMAQISSCCGNKHHRGSWRLDNSLQAPSTVFDWQLEGKWSRVGLNDLLLFLLLLSIFCLFNLLLPHLEWVTLCSSVLLWCQPWRTSCPEPKQRTSRWCFTV